MEQAREWKEERKRRTYWYNDSGDYGRKDPPVPIPNTEVKLSHAESTLRDTAWEDRSSPLFICPSIRKPDRRDFWFFTAFVIKTDFGENMRTVSANTLMHTLKRCAARRISGRWNWLIYIGKAACFRLTKSTRKNILIARQTIICTRTPPGIKELRKRF